MFFSVIDASWFIYSSFFVNFLFGSVSLDLRGVYSDTTQLKSTQLDVELSTRSQREQLSPISSERRDPVDSVCRS